MYPIFHTAVGVAINKIIPGTLGVLISLTGHLAVDNLIEYEQSNAEWAMVISVPLENPDHFRCALLANGVDIVRGLVNIVNKSEDYSILHPKQLVGCVPIKLDYRQTYLLNSLAYLYLTYERYYENTILVYNVNYTLKNEIDGRFSLIKANNRIINKKLQ